MSDEHVSKCQSCTCVLRVWKVSTCHWLA